MNVPQPTMRRGEKRNKQPEVNKCYRAFNLMEFTGKTVRERS